jgi:SAM-dependent methyltransferase
MKGFTRAFRKLLPYNDRDERLVEGDRPTRLDLYRYYSRGPERFWLSQVDGSLRVRDPSGRFRLEAVLDLLAPGDYDTLLDVGCGSGVQLARVLGEWPGSRAVAVDLSMAHLQAAQEVLAAAGVLHRCTLLQGDAEALPLRATFDAIICSEVLEHLLEPPRLLARLRTLCHPSTRLVVTVPQIYMGGRAGTFEISLDGELHRYFHDQFDLARITALLRGAGFRVERHLGTYFTFPKPFPVISYALRNATGHSPAFDRGINRLTRNVRAQTLVLRCSPATPHDVE